MPVKNTKQKKTVLKIKATLSHQANLLTNLILTLKATKGRIITVDSKERLFKEKNRRIHQVAQLKNLVSNEEAKKTE